MQAYIVLTSSELCVCKRAVVYRWVNEHAHVYGSWQKKRVEINGPLSAAELDGSALLLLKE